MSDLPAIKKELLSHRFVVPKYLQNYNTQTAFSRYVPHFKIHLPKVERIYITMLDGSKIAADCFFQKNKKEHPTIIVIGGAGGSSREFFPKSLSYKAYYYGFNVILLMQRGEGDTIHLTKSLFTAYPQHDLPIALEAFSKMGLKEMYMVGLSVGGWATLLTVETEKKIAKKYLSGVVAIATPNSVIASWKQVEKNPLYNWWLLQLYKNSVKRRLKVDPPSTWDIKAMKKVKSKEQFFEKFFSIHTVGSSERKVTVEEYSRRTDIVPLLNNIEIPTLIIHAYDDPVAPIDPFLHSKNPYLITLLSQHGGHGGFYTTKKLYEDLDGLWAQNRAMEFMRFLEKQKGINSNS